ncbi:hypothetical protein PV417_24885 [Streptomyces sp. ME19-03-3]|nr:hypothetical protein [Streptomyces sp. ME19-03-3]
MHEAEEANRTLWEQAPALPLPRDFLVGYRHLAAAALAHVGGGEAVSRVEMSARAIETVGFLEAGLGSAEGAVDFERSCQAAAAFLLEGWAEDPMSTMRRVRHETDVWALAYRRLARPELGLGHGVSG